MVELLQRNMMSDDEQKAFIGTTVLSNPTKHEQTLNETKSVANAFMVSSFIGWYYNAIVDSIWMLYVRSLLIEYYPTYNSHAIIVFLATTCNILIIIGILVISISSDKYGFGKLSLITSGIILISCGLQCIYINIILFIIGFLCEATVEEDIEMFSVAFFGKFLPYKTAVVYTGYWYTTANIAYILGLITSGVITTYVDSYRGAYFFALFIQFIRFIHLFITIRNKEIYLTEQQTQFIEYYQSIISTHESDESDESNEEEDGTLELKEFEKELFPLCLDKIHELNSNKYEDNNHSSLNSSFSTNNMKGKSNWIWMEFILNIIHFSIIQSQYSVTGQFYAVYMNDRFGVVTIISLSQIGVIAICDAVVALVYEYLQLLSIHHMYACLVVIDAVYVVLLAILFPATNKAWSDLYWFYMFLYGIIIGLSTAFAEIIILELQPKADTGKMGGFKSASRYVFGIFASFCISYSWQSDNDYVWFWYIQAFAVTIALCINIFLHTRRVCGKEQHIQ